jgi:hypothetical protein
VERDYCGRAVIASDAAMRRQLELELCASEFAVFVLRVPAMLQYVSRYYLTGINLACVIGAYP